ncbi:MAG: hypothetical protein ABR596_05615, partial [Halarsenatibacteraceae bacterium]
GECARGENRVLRRQARASGEQLNRRYCLSVDRQFKPGGLSLQAKVITKADLALILDLFRFSGFDLREMCFTQEHSLDINQAGVMVYCWDSIKPSF